jgi:hypothetical protein
VARVAEHLSIDRRFEIMQSAGIVGYVIRCRLASPPTGLLQAGSGGTAGEAAVAMETKTEVFAAPTETEARACLDRWKDEHPSASITNEHECVTGVILEPVTSRSPSQLRKIVSIVIEYKEPAWAQERRQREWAPKDDPLSLLG